MANTDTLITITQDAAGKFSAVPPPPAINIDLDDTISFDVKAACTVCFLPTAHFGKRINLTAASHGPYSPSQKGTVKFSILPYGSQCPAGGQGIETYSIKIG